MASATFQTVTPTSELPDFLRTTWKFSQLDLGNARRKNKLRDWTVSSLAETYIKAHLATYEKLLREGEEVENVQDQAPSLAKLSAGKIIGVLEASDNIKTDVSTIAKSLNTITLRQVLEDPRTSYLTLRSFLNLPQGFGPANAAEATKEMIDIDEAVLRNERYIRSRGLEANKDNKGLVNLDDAHVLFNIPSSNDRQQPLTITRRDPPKGGFECFNQRRERTISFQPSNKAFSDTFDRITGNILKGLNWDNVFVAGGIVLATLLHPTMKDGSTKLKDTDKRIQDGDIDLYIYGLGPLEATEKVKEIYEVWRSNLPANNQQKLVVKNSKTINFLADYPNRRVQIILKITSSPTQILLNFDLDICAMGFNGKEVLMLPRCARALETGYNIFTMVSTMQDKVQNFINDIELL